MKVMFCLLEIPSGMDERGSGERIEGKEKGRTEGMGIGICYCSDCPIAWFASQSVRE